MAEDLNTEMKLFSIKKWEKLLESSGLCNVKSYQTNASDNFPGTLVISAQKYQ